MAKLSGRRYIIGEEVIFISSIHPRLCNKKGKVVVVVNEPHNRISDYLIEFDNAYMLALHNGDGRGKKNRCWWVRDDQVLNKEDYLDYACNGKIT